MRHPDAANKTWRAMCAHVCETHPPVQQKGDGPEAEPARHNLDPPPARKSALPGIRKGCRARRRRRQNKLLQRQYKADLCSGQVCHVLEEQRQEPSSRDADPAKDGQVQGSGPSEEGRRSEEVMLAGELRRHPAIFVVDVVGLRCDVLGGHGRYLVDE